MRLLNTATVQLESKRTIPPYAILSHTWGEKEITFQDMEGPNPEEEDGYEKIKKACAVAAADGFEYIWADTSCIDKTSSAELSEAINSMFNWYQEAEVCYAYLADVLPNPLKRPFGYEGESFTSSRWFTRGWTLQELIAPSTVIFLNSEWQEAGTKSSLRDVISEITGIPVGFLLGDDLGRASVAQRISWASKRKTSRAEDIAYCLLGIFGIHMPMLYGEGESAFIRLQEELMKVSDDHSLFAWRSDEDHGGLLATSPAAFVDSGNIVPSDPFDAVSKPLAVSNKGIHLTLRFTDRGHQGLKLAILHCAEIGKENLWVGIYVRDTSLTKEYFEREHSEKLELLNPRGYPEKNICVQRGRIVRKSKREGLTRCVAKLVGIRDHDIAASRIHLHSNWELVDGLLTTVLSDDDDDNLFGQLLVVCKDGTWFQVLLKKRGRFLSANVITDLGSDSASSLSLALPEPQTAEPDRITKFLGDRKWVDVAIKKQFQSIYGEKFLAGVVEISYHYYSPLPSADAGLWFEYAALLEGSTGDSLLSYAVWRGFEIMVKMLLTIPNIEANLKDWNGRTPLSLAVEHGHEAIVKLLLSKTDVDVNSKDKDGDTPLLIAARQGHQDVAKLLLDTGKVQADSKNMDGQTPLYLAVQQGHTGIVKLLLYTGKVGINSIWTEQGRQTPLSLAAQKGHEEVVELLLETGKVKTDLKDPDGQMPLLYAVEEGHQMIVKILLNQSNIAEADSWYGQTLLWKSVGQGNTAVVNMLLYQVPVDSSARDSNGRTLLLVAAENGHKEMVKLLLDRTNIKVDAKDNNGRTLLSAAAEQGHEMIVKLLLDSGDVKADSKDKNGQTPLVLAVEQGREKIVKLLLDRTDVKTNVKGRNGQTLISIAAELGHERIFKLLLDKTNTKTDSKDKFGRTPLSLAAERGHDNIVGLLLDQTDVKINSKEKSGETPLSLAAREGHEAIVKRLINTGKIDPDFKYTCQPPLSSAAERGHEVIVKLLLDRLLLDTRMSAVNSLWGENSPLSLAAEHGHDAVVNLLLGTGKVDMTSKINSQTPLLSAAKNGHVAVVKLLLDRTNTKAGTVDWVGRTPLLLAAQNGHEAVIKLLLDRTNTKADWKGWMRRTPLSLAAQNGHEAVVKLLLALGEVDVNSQDQFGQTPLVLAAQNGHEAVVRLLLTLSDVDVDLKDKNGQTALSFAVRKGEEGVARLLRAKHRQT